jgi:hypothetical protein
VLLKDCGEGFLAPRQLVDRGVDGVDCPNHQTMLAA